MRRCCLSLAALFALATIACAADDDLLLYYTFDEQGAVAKDSSGNGLDGKFGAAWTTSPSGGAAEFDGQSNSVITLSVPENLRFGKGSWSFSAWVKPHQFSIEDRQNQRRLFTFGSYPAAYLVIDIYSDGRLTCYFCYKTDDGKTISTGASSAFKLKLDEWAYITLVVDRENREILPYVNGYCQGTVRMPDNFDGDYTLDGLTIGAGWHNYWGVMDEVKVSRRALTKQDVKDEFKRLKEVFGVEESPEAAAAERRAAALSQFDSIGQAWSKGDFDAVREACRAVMAAPEIPDGYRSYAHLRIAQSYVAQRDLAGAKAAYEQILAETSYPMVHRDEARECLDEMARQAKGLPARDPQASRTPVTAIDTFAAEVWVAPNGDDANDGTKGSPVASLTRARDLVRQAKARGVKGAIGVRIQSGEYRVTAPLELTAEDSGTADAPVVYRAEQKGGVVFYGGQRLNSFQPVGDAATLARLPEAARGKVVKCDLEAQGITDYGELKVRGFGQPPSPPTLEVFVDGRPMTLARWPNEGFVGIEELVEPGNRAEGKPSIIKYQGDRPTRWTQAEAPWLFGYFRFLWADATIAVSKIDAAAKIMTCDEAYHYGRPGMDTGQGIQYYAFNLLEEIDQPGEWYLDRTSGILYLYPPKDLSKATVEVGLLSTPMVTMNGVSDVRLEGLTFDLARYNGLELTDCSRCLLAGCTISRMAGNGVMIHGGTEDGLLGCDIHTIGRRASEVIGGDRETLTPGRHFVENCQIHNFGRIDRTYTPAIQLEGVGHHIAHNLMYDCPSSTMRIEGNDHLIEFNEVHSAVLESDDQGGMELFRNATYRGVVFRYNRYVNCGKPNPGVAVHGQAAIRFDDAISGMLVYSNIFVDSANGNFGAIQMNSGRDNIMDNNVFIGCKQGISGGWNPGNSVWRMLKAGNQPADFITNELYLQRYDTLATMLDEPGINHVWRNVFLDCGQTARSNLALLDMMGNEVLDEDPGFVDAAHGDVRLKPDSKLLQSIGFKPIPVSEIGLYQDRYRASWPVETTPVERADWHTAK